MSHRRRAAAEELKRQRCTAEDTTRTQECEMSADAEDARMALELLADYFALLQKWELKSRSDNGLAPDSPAEKS
jgi:hypothetical protein